MSIETISDAALTKAAQLLRSGKLVAFPTETVYGLGADATNEKAVAEIFAVKGRPSFNPLIVHVSDIAMAQHLVVWSVAADKLAKAFWPGPLTLVLQRRADSPVALLVSAGGDTLAIRCPAHDAARKLIMLAGKPLAAPSANRSGHVSPTNAWHVQDEFDQALSLILDGGACKVGIESTVLDITGTDAQLLRPGFVTRERLEQVLGHAVHVHESQGGIFKSPGMLEKHYAPSLPVRLEVTDPKPTEALIAFGANVPEGSKHAINLSETGDLKEAAAHLFATLRALDKPEYTAIAAMPIPQEGLGVAINDRLARAACKS